ncbi:MAG: glycosyltransferase [Rhodocyclaceae bacterium]
MKKRILLLDTGKEWGGGTNSMIELLKRIDRERFEVTAFFYRNYRKGDASDLRAELAAIGIPLEIEPPLRQPLWAKLAKELTRGVLRPFPESRRRLLHAIERRWRILPSARRIADRLGRGQFDLLYMNNQPSSNLEGYLAAEIANLPVVQHCRIEVTLQAQEAAVVNRIARRIVCVSEGVRESLLAQGVRPDLCRVVYNAIDGRQRLPDAVALPASAGDALVIGSIGSLIERKANDHLLRAAARVHERCTQPLHIVLVGEGPERERLARLAEQLGLAGQTQFAGFQQQPLAWAAAMDIVVLASAKEGLPRVVLEAMLLGKPVIASDVVGSRELVKHGLSGFLYPYGDEDALADHLQQLLQNAELRREMGAAGRQDVLQNYSIEHYVSSVEALLLEAAA